MTNGTHDLSKLHIDRDTPPAVRRAFSRNLLLAGVAVVLLAGLVLFARRGGAVPVQVVVATATAGGGGGAAGSAVTANGYVVARTRASVSSKVAGRLAFLGVSEGSFVHKGEIIARLESADYQAAIAQAQAAVASARADSIEMSADRDQLEREAQRLRTIHTQNAQLVAQQDVDQAESRAAQAAARAQAAIARVGGAVAGLRFAEANFDNTVIRAPFTGTVLRKEAEVGEVVAPSVGGGLTRGAVVTMADLGTLEVEVDVNEAYIARIQHNQPARITLDAYPDTALPRHGAPGRADRGSPAGDRAGQGEHHRPRPAHPSRDGCAGGLPRNRYDPARRCQRPRCASGCRRRRCERTMVRAWSGWCARAGSSGARCRLGPSVAASARSAVVWPAENCSCRVALKLRVRVCASRRRRSPDLQPPTSNP